MGLTIATYVSRLRRRLGDTQADGFFTTSSLEDYGSEAQRDISMRLRPDLLPELHTVDTGTIQSGSYFAVTSDISQFVSLTVYNATNQDVEVSLVPDTNAYKMLRSRNSFFQPGDKQYYAFMENSRLYIEPDRATDTFKLRYIKAPVSVSGTDVMVLNDHWEDLALDYGESLARRAENRDAEADKAYMKYIEKVKTANGGGK